MAKQDVKNCIENLDKAKKRLRKRISKLGTKMLLDSDLEEPKDY